MAEAWGIACHELVSLDFRSGSKPEVSDGHENVGFRGQSGSRFRATGCLFIANSGDDKPVLMINLNKYNSSSNFPNGKPYKDYMRALNILLKQVVGKILWQIPVFGQPFGNQNVDEIIGAWYPTHKSFLSLKSQSGSEENFKLRGLCLHSAVIHRCPDGIIPKP